MYDRKQIVNKSPDTRKMQEVIIDGRTRIYIAASADPVEARNRFLERVSAKNKIVSFGKKPDNTKS